MMKEKAKIFFSKLGYQFNHSLSFPFMLLVIFFTSSANALDGEGTIEELNFCATGGAWKQILLFKLSDGSWFGHFAEVYGTSATDRDGNTGTSAILMAFSAEFTLSIRANYYTGTYCGVEAAMIHNDIGDYIKIKRN